MTNALQIGDKVRMLETNSPYYRYGQEGVVVYQDADGYFWVGFGDDPEINPIVANWISLEDDTWCVGPDETTLLRPLEVIS